MDLVCRTPFWSVRNGLVTSYSALDESSRCHVIVLGGRITGAVAWHLAQAGMEVVRVDKCDVATRKHVRQHLLLAI